MRGLLFTVFVVSIAFFSCGKLDNLIVIHKNIPYSYDADIPNLPNPGGPFPAGGVSVPFPRYTVVTNSSQFIKDNNTNPDLITSVKATELNISLLQPANGYLNFIDSIKVYVSADGLAEQLAAYKYGIPNNINKVDLTCENVELKEYFLKDSMYFRVTAHFVNFPDSNSRVQINTTLAVAANPLK